jgi:hypothetical protein
MIEPPRRGELKTFEMSVYELLFNCPKCGWWAIGAHSSDEPINRDKLADALFGVECTSKECGWKGQLPGKDGHSLTRNQSE